jgi:hypothetical protein
VYTYRVGWPTVPQALRDFTRAELPRMHKEPVLMAKFKIIETGGDIREVEADSYRHEDGMIAFIREDKFIFSIAAAQVKTVARDDVLAAEPAPDGEQPFLAAWR